MDIQKPLTLELNESAEFWCLWFQSKTEWRAVFADGEISQGFPAVGYAVQHAMRRCGRGEVEFWSDEVSPDVYCYLKDKKHWKKRKQTNGR